MDVARYLAANTTTGFMFLSAFGDSDIIDEATRIGALGYLVKPIDVKQIVPAVRAALARSGTRATNRAPGHATSGDDHPDHLVVARRARRDRHPDGAAAARLRRRARRAACAGAEPKAARSTNWPRTWSTQPIG